MGKSIWTPLLQSIPLQHFARATAAQSPHDFEREVQRAAHQKQKLLLGDRHEFDIGLGDCGVVIRPTKIYDTEQRAWLTATLMGRTDL
jgi:hypothetical protein